MAARRTRNNRINRRSGGSESNKAFIAIGICLIAVLLAAAILLTKRRSNADNAAREEAESLAESIAESARYEEESLAAMEALSFDVCGNDRINVLVEDYFEARLAADSSRIFEIFGRSDTSPDEDYEAKLKAQASWIQDFDDITVYEVPGEADDDLFCIITYEIDFRRTDTLAPGIMYAFAVKNADGSYNLAENLLKEKVDYAAEVLGGASAAALINDVNVRLKEALLSDSTLALIYVSFQNGEIYKESELDVDADQDVNIYFGAADSVLVGEDILAEIAAEAAEAASAEAAEGEADVYETETIEVIEYIPPESGEEDASEEGVPEAGEEEGAVGGESSGDEEGTGGEDPGQEEGGAEEESGET